MEDETTQGDSLTERQREWQARREWAVKLLKGRGIWDKLLDDGYWLEHIHSGLMRVTDFELDVATGTLRETAEEYDGIWPQDLAFILRSHDVLGDEEWFYERSEEYEALETLVE